MTSHSAKCAHPNCTCRVTVGKYCSAQCETMDDTPGIECACPHPECVGRNEASAGLASRAAA
jgi:hypothetical protein